MPDNPERASAQQPEASKSSARAARRRRATAHSLWIAGALLAIPGLLIAFKSSSLPGSVQLSGLLSFEGLSPDLRVRTEHLLFAPVGALLVVFARLTLGIRVLGPFRSVLLALAFPVTGPWVGLSMFAVVIAVVVGLRPVLRRMRLPYFGRSTAKLAAVAGVLVAVMLVGVGLGIASLERVAYFPIVVLTLAGDAFSTALRREGAVSAVWRAAATAGVALVITAIASVQTLQDCLVRSPELVLVALGLIVLVCKLLALRLFQGLNPPVKRTRERRKARAGESEPVSVPAG